MVGTRKAKQEDSNVWFSREKKAGILIQPQFRKATYFVNGENIDTLWYEKDAPASEVEHWIESKRKHYMSLPQ
jgi:hypothetical protein